MISFKNILVPIDLSKTSINSFFLGCSLAQQNSGLVHLMHVIKPNYVTGSLIDEEKVIDIKIDNVKEELYKFINEIPHPAADIVEVIKFGAPESEILNYSLKNKIDLIIVNSHGWTGKLNSLMGEIANNVFKHSMIPVICLKSYSESAKDFSENYSTAENWVG